MVSRRQQKVETHKRAQAANPSYVGRRYAVLGLFALVGLALVLRAFDQQVLEKDFLQSEGADRYLDVVKVEAHRGLVTDRRGDVLALSTPVDSIGANPRVLKADAEGLLALADALEMPMSEVQSKLASARRFVYLRRRMPPAQASYVIQVAKQYKLRGLQRDREYRRYYPTGEVFSHVVGFTGIDDTGQEGLELAYDKALSGTGGLKRVMRDGRRQVVDDIENIQLPRDGQNLALSLDRRLQFIAYRELKSAVQKHKAKSGSLVLLDTRTGEVLAMVNQPAYNPNGNRGSLGGSLRNRGLTDVYEPGSAMKPFAVAAAMDMGVIDADSVIDTTPGFINVGSYTVKDTRNLGAIDVTTVLRKSSNVGISKIALKMDKEDYWEVLYKLGFGQHIGSGFPGEVSGQLIDFHDWATIDQATLAYGYGISVTTMQLARAYTALAADGVLRPVSLLKLDKPPVGERVLSRHTARRVRDMLQTVVSPEGTAPLAAVPGYRVAGKTGTVKKLGKKGYSDDRYIALFAGMAPATDPHLAMVVMIDEPSAGKYYGGLVAGPVFSRVMAESLRLMNVRPDNLPRQPLRLVASGGA